MANYRPQWEHHIEYLQAQAYVPAKPEKQGFWAPSELVVKDFLKKFYPGEYPVPKYAVEATLERLDKLGAQGWELVQMQPVELGENGDVRITGQTTYYTHVYLCIFKRLKRSAQP